MKKHKYFASYVIVINAESFHGNMVCDSDKEITEYEHGVQLQEEIKRINQKQTEMQVEGAVLLNFIKL